MRVIYVYVRLLQKELHRPMQPMHVVFSIFLGHHNMTTGHPWAHRPFACAALSMFDKPNELWRVLNKRPWRFSLLNSSKNQSQSIKRTQRGWHLIWFHRLPTGCHLWLSANSACQGLAMAAATFSFIKHNGTKQLFRCHLGQFPVHTCHCDEYSQGG